MLARVRDFGVTNCDIVLAVKSVYTLIPELVMQSGLVCSHFNG